MRKKERFSTFSYPSLTLYTISSSCEFIEYPNKKLAKFQQMSEDEALARALELSLNGPSSSRSAPMTDEELAEQLQREENLKATRTNFR